MRVLQLCLRVPYPPRDGGSMAMHSITEGLLNNGCTVKVLAVSTQKHPANLNVIEKSYQEKTGLEIIEIDTKVKLTAAFLNLFSTESYNIQRFYSPAFEKRLIEILKEEKYDVVILESLFMASYLPAIKKNPNAKIILRSHNIEYHIWKRLAQNESNPLKKKYLVFLSKRLKKFELENMNRFDGIACITSVDETTYKKLGCTIPLTTIPYGINLNEFQVPEKTANNKAIFHLASMDWLPNLEAVDWFLQTVWDKIIKANTDIHLYLAGKSMPDRLLQLNNNHVHVNGIIHHSKEYMKDKQVMIVPLLSGGGMRIKIIEGLALGKTIISTSIGAEGIPCEHNKNILLADTPDDFAQAILKCVSDESFCKFIGDNARKLAEKNYNNDDFCKKLILFCQEC